MADENKAEDLGALGDALSAADAMAGGDEHAKAIIDGAISGASTGIAVGTAVGEAASIAASVGIGTAIGNAIPIPGIGAAIGAIVGAVVAAVNAGSMSPAEARKALEQFQREPIAAVALLKGAGLPLVIARGHYRWLFDRAGVKRPAASPFDSDAWLDAVWKVANDSTLSAEDARSVARFGHETPAAARKLLALFRDDPDRLRDWIHESAEIAQKDPTFASSGGWAWATGIARAAGEAGLFDAGNVRAAFLDGAAEIPKAPPRKAGGAGAPPIAPPVARVALQAPSGPPVGLVVLGVLAAAGLAGAAIYVASKRSAAAAPRLTPFGPGAPRADLRAAASRSPGWTR
jgi:hypothetical protein